MDSDKKKKLIDSLAEVCVHVSSESYVDYCTRFHENSVIAYFKGVHGRFNTV